MKGNLRACGFWLIPAAYFVGRCSIFGMNPLAVALLVAVCLQNESVFFTYCALLLGMATQYSMGTIIRYAFLMLVLMLIFTCRKCIMLKRERFFAALLSGMITLFLNAVLYRFLPSLVWGDNVSTTQLIGSSFVANVLLEGVLVFSISLIYEKALAVVRTDFARLSTDSECAIAVMLFCASVLLGMPEKGPFELVIAESFSLFSVLMALYVFGGGLGLAWTVLVGFLRAGQQMDMAYLFCYVILGMVSVAVLQVLFCGRFLLLAFFVCTFFLCGLWRYDILLSWDNKKALFSASFLFLLLPKTILIRVEQAMYKNGATGVSSVWGKLVMERVNNFAAAMKRIDYTFAGSANVGATFSEMGMILEDFASIVPREVSLKKTIEASIVDKLARKNIRVLNLSLTKDKDGRFTIYITLCSRRYKLITAELIRKIVAKEMGIQLLLTEDSRRIVGTEPTLVCLQEMPGFKCVTAVRKLSRYASEVSGDNFYIGEIVPGKMLFMIADGMGNGTQASVDSNLVLEALEELLRAGFEQEMAIRIVNTYMAEQNKGERFATLDLLLIDLYTGHGVICKQGAATTYIRRGSWMELVKSTSLPIGIVQNAACEQCTKKFYNRDMIVLVSDGVLESIIFENKEDYLRSLLVDNAIEEPEELVSYIVREIRGMCGNRLKDDATIIACKLVKTL